MNEEFMLGSKENIEVVKNIVDRKRKQIAYRLIPKGFYGAKKFDP